VPFALLGWSLIFGVAAIALWCVVRFPRLAPETARGVGAWVAAAFGSTLATQLSLTVFGSGMAPRPALVLLVLPSGVCTMLSVAWTFRWAMRTSFH
jgi:hypothetical protein